MKDEAKVAYATKQYYKISDELKELLQTSETKAERDEYFEYIEMCIQLDICTECGQPIVRDEFWRIECAKEYSISGLCKDCQIAIFGS